MTAREFRRRLDRAQAFEEKVAAELVARGWVAERFGQGQLSEQMRDMIKRVKTRVRYMPDIIAAKRFGARTSLIFVDAKAGDKWRETGRHDVEAAALDGAEAFQAMADCPVYFVFSDGGVVTPAVFRELAAPGPYRGVGSGTPFLLATREVCQRFDAVFGFRDAWTELAS
jgi:hypothetical protein